MVFNSFSPRHATCLVCAFSILVLYPLQAMSDGPAPKLIADWYEALRQNDHEAMENLLAPDALVELRDIGITQTKAEFVESLDEWSELNADTDLHIRLDTAGADGIVMDVCYRFTSNEVQTREVFLVSGDRIARSVQEQISQSCNGIWD